MAKKKERAVNVSGKPRHSLDVNRANDKKGAGGGGGRSAATVRRLKMYNTRPKRDRSGKVLKHDLPSKELPNTRIEPDRRWFGHTRVVSQKELQFFREEFQSRLSNNYNVILKERKLPLSLLQDHQKQARPHLLDTEPSEHAFGRKGKRKRPKLLAFDYKSLLNKADDSQDAFEEKYVASKLPKEEDRLRDLVRHTMFEKGQGKRIWGGLYKVIDSSDVVVQVLDARYPMGTRSYHLEKDLKENAKHKHLVFLLNKSSRRGFLMLMFLNFPTPEEIFADHPDHLQLYKSMIGSDGWCTNYDKSTRTCNIYQDRPFFCRVEPKVFYEFFGVPRSRFDREACSACVDNIKMVYGEDSAELSNFKRVIREESNK